MGDNYFLLTNLLSEDERKVITSITAHIERGEKRAGIQQIAAENYLRRHIQACAKRIFVVKYKLTKYA